MKRIIITALCLCLVLLTFAGCGAEKSEKITVVATLFPQYDFVKNIAADRADISLLLNFGTDAHSYDPTPNDIMKIVNADLFIYTGNDMELWAKNLLESSDIAKAVESGSLTVLDLSQSVELLEFDEHEHEGEHSADTDEKDPHIWTSFRNAALMCDSIANALSAIDADGKALYETNLASYKEKLVALDAEMQEVVSASSLDCAYFGGSFAFAYLFSDYSLDHHSVFSGCASHAEASYAEIQEIIAEIRQSGAEYVLYDSQSELKIATTISEETGAEVLRLHAIHNISKDEYDAGENYISLSKHNIEVLGKALG